MSNTAPSRADPVVVFPLGRWCPPQETSQPHPPHLIVQVLFLHYSDVIMSVTASQITSFMIVYSTVYSGADQRKHQSSASKAFDDVIMILYIFQCKLFT